MIGPPFVFRSSGNGILAPDLLDDGERAIRTAVVNNKDFCGCRVCAITLRNVCSIYRSTVVEWNYDANALIVTAGLGVRCSAIVWSPPSMWTQLL